jgi:hypothetical protein
LSWEFGLNWILENIQEQQCEMDQRKLIEIVSSFTSDRVTVPC